MQQADTLTIIEENGKNTFAEIAKLGSRLTWVETCSARDEEGRRVVFRRYPFEIIDGYYGTEVSIKERMLPSLESVGPWTEIKDPALAPWRGAGLEEGGKAFVVYRDYYPELALPLNRASISAVFKAVADLYIRLIGFADKQSHSHMNFRLVPENLFCSDSKDPESVVLTDVGLFGVYDAMSQADPGPHKAGQFYGESLVDRLTMELDGARGAAAVLAVLYTYLRTGSIKEVAISMEADYISNNLSPLLKPVFSDLDAEEQEILMHHIESPPDDLAAVAAQLMDELSG